MNSKNEMKIALEGAVQSIDMIYLEYKDQLYRFVYRYTGDRQFSIDIVQDTFEKLMKKGHQYSPEKGTFKTYLFQIAYHTMATKLKRRQKLASLLPFLTSGQKTGFGIDEKIMVQQAIHSLPEDQRAVVLLVYYHDLAQKEVARILDVPLGTVKSRLHHALKKLKMILEVNVDE